MMLIKNNYKKEMVNGGTNIFKDNIRKKNIERKEDRIRCRAVEKEAKLYVV